MQSCVHRLPTDPAIRGSQWPVEWPLRLEKPPYWLKNSEAGVYGKPATEDFQADYEHWKQVISNSYMNDLGIDWSAVRNVMDMKAAYGGYAIALASLLRCLLFFQCLSSVFFNKKRFTCPSRSSSFHAFFNFSLIAIYVGRLF